MINLPGLENAQPHGIVEVDGALVGKDVHQLVFDYGCTPSYF